jgi:hypothetical protein
MSVDRPRIFYSPISSGGRTTDGDLSTVTSVTDVVTEISGERVGIVISEIRELYQGITSDQRAHALTDFTRLVQSYGTDRMDFWRTMIAKMSENNEVYRDTSKRLHELTGVSTEDDSDHKLPASPAMKALGDTLGTLVGEIFPEYAARDAEVNGRLHS